MPEEQPQLPDSGKLLDLTLTGLVQAVAGIAASPKKDWALSFSYLAQRLRGGRFLSQLQEEIRKYQLAGAIKEDYLATEQSYACLQEILDSIDCDSPDQIRVSAMQRVFIAAALEKFSDRNSVLPAQLMRICRSLSSGEVLVLSHAYDIYGEFLRNLSDPAFKRSSSVPWREAIAKKSGLAVIELVQIHEEQLVAKQLLSGFMYPDKSGFHVLKHQRLTPLGYELCRFISDTP